MFRTHKQSERTQVSVRDSKTKEQIESQINILELRKIHLEEILEQNGEYIMDGDDVCWESLWGGRRNQLSKELDSLYLELANLYVQLKNARRSEVTSITQEVLLEAFNLI